MQRWKRVEIRRRMGRSKYEREKMEFPLGSKWIKIPMVLLHLLSAVLLVGGVFLFLDGRLEVSRVTEEKKFTDSAEFTGRMFTDMQNVLYMGRWKEVLETNGELDMSKVVLKVREPDGSVTDYCLDDIVSAKIGGGYTPKGFFGSPLTGTSYEENTAITMIDGTGISSGIEYDEAMDSGIPEESVSDWVTGSDEDSDIDRIKVIWFACDERFDPVYVEKDTEEAWIYSRSAIGWKVSEQLENYQWRKEMLEKSQNFYYAFTGSKNEDNGKTAEEIMALGKYYISERTVRGYDVDTNLNVESADGDGYFVLAGMQGGRYVPGLHIPDDIYLSETGDRFFVGVDTDFPAEDDYSRLQERWEKEQVVASVDELAVWTAVFLLTLIYLLLAAGKTAKKEAGICLNFFDRIPFELLIAGGVAVFGAAFVLMENGYYSYSYVTLETGLFDSWAPVLSMTAGVTVLYFYGLAVLLRLIRRKRFGESCSLLVWCVKWIGKTARENRKLSLRVGLAVIVGMGLVALLSFFTGIFFYEGTFVLVITGFLTVLIVGASAAVLLKKAQEQERLRTAVSRIAAGDMSGDLSSAGELSLAGYTGAEREMAENINHIQDGLAAAVEKAMKNERMKTELISNVSHDIKTPLTSIINYADLLKRELSEDFWNGVEGKDDVKEKVDQYLAVLEQKGKRMKVLTEDLVEASKASSGVLQLELERINLVELTAQVNGEFEERFAEKNLQLVPTLWQEPVYIRADGRRLWRILENLYQNVYKYAMSGTRVYAEVGMEQENAVYFEKYFCGAASDVGGRTGGAVRPGRCVQKHRGQRSGAFHREEPHGTSEGKF